MNEKIGFKEVVKRFNLVDKETGLYATEKEAKRRGTFADVFDVVKIGSELMKLEKLVLETGLDNVKTGLYYCEIARKQAEEITRQDEIIKNLSSSLLDVRLELTKIKQEHKQNITKIYEKLGRK